MGELVNCSEKLLSYNRCRERKKEREREREREREKGKVREGERVFGPTMIAYQ